MNTHTYSPDDLRNATLEHLIANVEVDDSGRMYDETPLGLRILYGPSWMSVGGAVIVSPLDNWNDTLADYSVEWIYHDPTSPHVVRTAWSKDGSFDVTEVHPVQHNQVASALMKLLVSSEMCAAVS